MAVHDRTRLTGLLTFLKAGKSDVFWKNVGFFYFGNLISFLWNDRISTERQKGRCDYEGNKKNHAGGNTAVSGAGGHRAVYCGKSIAGRKSAERHPAFGIDSDRTLVCADLCHTEMAEQKEVRGYKGGISHERQREKNAGI